MMIRRERAGFLDNLLKLFPELRVFKTKDLEKKCQGNTYLLVQTEKHLKILEKDGMIKCNVLDEYYLEPKGQKVINDLSNLGYIAKHKIEEAEWKRLEEEAEDDEIFLTLPLHLLFDINH